MGWLALLGLLVCLPGSGQAGTIQFSDVRVFVHHGEAPWQ